MLPAAFINSHLDGCLTGGSKPGSKANGLRSFGSNPRAGSGKAAEAAKLLANERSGGGGREAGSSKQPLKVPPKLCVALLSDKAMREHCRKYGLPTAGKKEVC